MRYLVRFDPDRSKIVQEELRLLNLAIVDTVFDYYVLDIPEEAAPRVRAVPGVVDVRPEGKLAVMQRRARAVPIDKKLARFMRLASNPLTLPEAMSFSIEADAGKEYFTTSESRKMLGADEAEAEGYTGEGVKVAVIDTGSDASCVQLLGLTGKSSVEGQAWDYDDSGHGVWCASCVGGKEFPTTFGVLKGVAPDVELGVFKCLGYGIGTGTSTSVLRSLMDAFEWGAEIISMSLGSAYTEEPTDRIPECRAIKMLTDAGIIVVVANGNDGPAERTVGNPACSPYALSVGAVDKDGNIADFSSRGPTQEDLVKPDCVAPGVDILSSTSTMSLIDNMQFQDGPRLACISGSSMSTPHVAGLMAIWTQYLRERGIELTTGMAMDIMRRYGTEKNNETGWGLPNYNWVKRYYGEVFK